MEHRFIITEIVTKAVYIEAESESAARAEFDRLYDLGEIDTEKEIGFETIVEYRGTKEAE